MFSDARKIYSTDFGAEAKGQMRNMLTGEGQNHKDQHDRTTATLHIHCRKQQAMFSSTLFGQNLQPQHLSAWFYATALLSPCPDSNIIKFPFLLF